MLLNLATGLGTATKMSPYRRNRKKTICIVCISCMMLETDSTPSTDRFPHITCKNRVKYWPSTAICRCFGYSFSVSCKGTISCWNSKTDSRGKIEQNHANNCFNNSFPISPFTNTTSSLISMQVCRWSVLILKQKALKNTEN